MLVTVRNKESIALPVAIASKLWESPTRYNINSSSDNLATMQRNARSHALLKGLPARIVMGWVIFPEIVLSVFQRHAIIVARKATVLAIVRSLACRNVAIVTRRGTYPRSVQSLVIGLV